MCIVIDTNTFSSVFDEDNELHEEFKPVKAWLDKGLGFMVYGGTKYRKEVITGYRRTRLVRLMTDAGRAIAISDSIVDAIEKTVKSNKRSKGCNDHHIISLLTAANCDLLCSNDKESFPHIKNRDLYPKKFPKIRIYTNRKNSQLLKKTSRESIRNKA